jgi:opacity protein-like surface antigen
MISRTVLATLVTASLGTAALAQEARWEVSANAGYTFSDGVSGSATDRFGDELSRIDPKDSFSWNLRAAYLPTHNLEFGAFFGMQTSSLVVGVRTPAAASGNFNEFTLGDENIYHYHGYFAYNFGESEKVQPYVLMGLGVTQFGSVTVTPVNLPTPLAATAQSRTIDSSTKFSTIWAAGVKYFPGKSFGVRVEGRWVPTYIKSDAAGWWCDPYWGCYTVGNSQYSNQFELGGGIAVRF